MNVLKTERLNIRQLISSDADFIFELLNEPAFIRNIGDRGVRTTDDAVQYILNGPVSSYERHGFGLWMVELADSKVPIGISGLLKRDSLEDVDIGFAFLPQFWRQGFAVESASAVMSYGHDVLGLQRLVAITNPDNAGSIKVLEKLGMKFERMVQMPGETFEIMLFARDL